MTPGIEIVAIGACALVCLGTLVIALSSPNRRVKWTLLPLAAFCLILAFALTLPLLLKPRVAYARSSCVANLKLMAGAKATWAMEFRKLPADIPRDADLVGPTNYILEKPACPQGGTYQLRAIEEDPVCSIGGPEHSLR